MKIPDDDGQLALVFGWSESDDGGQVWWINEGDQIDIRKVLHHGPFTKRATLQNKVNKIADVKNTIHTLQNFPGNRRGEFCRTVHTLLDNPEAYFDLYFPRESYRTIKVELKAVDTNGNYSK